MKKIIIILLFAISCYSQTAILRQYTGNYVIQDSIVGSSISGTTYMSAADRKHFASQIVPTSDYSISKITLFINCPAANAAIPDFTATIYADGVSTNPGAILATSADSIDGATLVAGAYYIVDFRFDPAVPVTSDTTYWFGPSSSTYNATHSANIARYTDAAFSGITRRGADQSTWVAYLTDPLGVRIWSSPVTADTGQDKGFKEHSKFKRFKSLK